MGFLNTGVAGRFYFNKLNKKYKESLNDVTLNKFHVKPDEFHYLITGTVNRDRPPASRVIAE